MKDGYDSLLKIPGVNAGLADALCEKGLFSIEEMSNASVEDLIQIQDISEEKAQELIDGAQDILEEMVESGEVPLAIVQKCGTVLLGSNVEEIGVVMYEVAHLVSFKGSPVTEVDDLEEKDAYTVGINKQSGSYVTWQMFEKVDKDYKRATVLDYTKTTKAINGMKNGEFQSMFFVSAPGTKAIKRMIKAGVIFRDIDDGDFNDYKHNKQKLYNFVDMKKKMGYPNNFETVYVQDVLVANVDWLEENEDAYDALYDACDETFNKIKVSKKFKFYPKKR